MRRLWLGLLMGLLAAVARSQGIDASHLDAPATIDAAWRFHVGDDPAIAQSDVDDSAWPLLKPDQVFANAGLPAELHGGSVWLRLHVKNASSPLGIDLATSVGLPYEVFANGRKIAESPGWAGKTQSLQTPFAIALPPANQIVLAVHMAGLPSTIFRRSPLSSVEIGSLPAIANTTELGRLRNFTETVPGVVETGVFFILGIVAFFLFFSQRAHPEYLWLGLLMLDTAVYLVVNLGMGLGAFNFSYVMNLAICILGFLMLYLSLQFVIVFSLVRSSLLLRLLMASYALGPILFLTVRGSSYYLDVLLVQLPLWIIAVSYCLIDAYRRGRGESGLLLPTFALFGSVNFLSFLSARIPAISGAFKNWNVGHFEVNIADFAIVLFLGGLFLVVLVRFIRVSREQQQSEAEFEAARTVQQVLIPEQLPQIAGLRIASIYKPAQQVGGDFFQIIPVEAGAALVVVGDVSGKGMQAAMTVSLLVGALRMAVETTQSPGLLMAALNRRLHGRGTGFTTCIILHVSRDGEVIAANAGHLQPYLAGRELAIEAGLPLGFDADAEYVETRFILPASETLTLVTDGVVEATNAKKELFGFARTEAVSTMTALDIASAAERFAAPAAQADDITVLTLVRAG